MSLREPADYSSEFREVIGALGLEAVLIGGLAANEYRQVPRMTTDVDFLVRDLGDLQRWAEAEGYNVRVMSDPGEDPHVVFIRGKGIAVDVLAAQTEYQQEALDRAIDGVITAEDVIIHKLLAWRPRDRDDVRSILATGRPLDLAYIVQWAEQWEVLDRWSEALTLRPGS